MSIKDEANIGTNESLDDDELSPIFSLPAHDKKVFKQNDIVWMKLNGLYVPGVVSRVWRKKRCAYVKCINRPGYEKSYRIPVKDLKDFNNNLRNRQYLQESRKEDPAVQAAFDKIAVFFNENLKAGGTLSAVKYFTSDNDDLGTFLTKLRERKEVEPMQKRSSGDEWCPSVILDSKEKNETGFSSGEDSEEISQDQLEQESKSLLKIIRSLKCKKHIQNIFTEDVESSRHSVFMTKIVAEQRRLQEMAGLGSFSIDMGIELVKRLDEYLCKIDKLDKISNCGSRNDYLINVLVPEAIIFALRTLYKLSYQEAEQRFTKLSAKVI